MKSFLKYSGANRALAFATLAFSANFSVCVLYAGLSLELQKRLSLSYLDLGFLFAAPMVTASLLRIPSGFIADKYNPKTLFSLQMLLVVPALAFLPYASTLAHHMLLGLWIGVSGTSFTLGIRYVTDWFERNQQGTAMGIFGVGNAGAAITLALVPLIETHIGWSYIGPIYAAGLLFMAVIFALFAPNRPAETEIALDKPNNISLKEIISTLQIWRFSLYYYFVFGSFLALILWLPQYYVNAYGLSHKQALAFTLFFVATSSMVRALGGWFSDRYGGRAVNWTVFWICLICLFILSYPQTSMTIHGVHKDVNINIEINVWLFSSLIFIIGVAQGFGRASVYKIINDYYPNNMGSVGGFVAALGATGGFTLPIAFGFVVDLIGIYSACFMLLYGVLATCMIAMFFANKSDRFKRRFNDATSHNFLESD